MFESRGTLLPFEFSHHNRVVLDPDKNQIICAEDFDLSSIVEVNRCVPNLSGIVFVKPEKFDQLLSDIFSEHHSSSELVMEDIRDFIDMESAAEQLEESSDLLEAENDAPIVRLLNAIIAQSLKAGASDIHIEPYEKTALVRFRLDGVLHTVLSPSAQIFPLLCTRIKVMARLDIAERRLPQDGRMSVRLGGRTIDLRVSTMPSTHGERVVMRILEKEAGKLQVDDLGMRDHDKAQLDELIRRPHGMILVTGPTGSGKTTTLYAALQRLNRHCRNIMTVEDPVEYNLPGISQTQINLRAGMTFSRGLRAILRQDPDVILIGEIRDGETAEIAAQASLTGHLVLSTLHTNTATGAITRLQDLGVDSYLLASTVRGILSQRLIRKLCTHCKTATVISDHDRELLGPGDFQLYRPGGCVECNNTGFCGRRALFELVTLDPTLQALIHEQRSELELERVIRSTVPSLRQAGLSAIREGVTTVDEVLRATSV